MGEFIKVNFLMIRDMVLGNSSGKTVECIRENGIMVNNMVLGNFKMRKVEEKERVNGLKEKEKNGLKMKIKIRADQIFENEVFIIKIAVKFIFLQL